MISKISNYFHTLFSLVSIQMKNKSSLSLKNNKASAIIKALVYLILFAGLTAGCYFLFKLFQDDSIFGILVFPIYFFNFIFISVFALITITTIFRFKSELYLAPDNQILLMLPTSKNQMFVSKIIVCYLMDFFRNMLFVAPLFISYAILNNFVPGFYPWLVFTLIFILMIPVCFGAILSIVIFNIQLWLRKHYITRNISIAVIIIILFVGLIFLCTLIPKELRIDEKWETVILPHLKNFVLFYEKLFYPFTMLSMLVLGYTTSSKSPYRLPIFTDKTGIIFAIIIGFIVLTLLINLLIFKKFFISTISKGNEHSKTLNNVLYKHSLNNIYYKAIYAYKNNHLLNKDEYTLLLNELYEKEPKLFMKNEMLVEDYLPLLTKHFRNIEFKIDKISDIDTLGFILIRPSKGNRLVIINKLEGNTLECYDPYEFERKNKSSSGIKTLIKKNIIHDLRNSYDLFINVITIFVPSVAIFALNTIFSGLRLTVFGGQLVFAFTIFVILLLLTLYASIASSLYSKSQKNAYVLNVSPYSKTINIFTSLLHLFVIGFISILLLSVNYGYTTPLKDVNIGYLLVAILAIFAFLLLVNASIDLGSLKKYNFTAVTSEKAGDQNELYAFIISMIIIIAFSGLGFLYFRLEKESACLYLMASSILVLLIYSIILYINRLIKKHKRRRLA